MKTSFKCTLGCKISPQLINLKIQFLNFLMDTKIWLKTYIYIIIIKLKGSEYPQVRSVGNANKMAEASERVAVYQKCFRRNAILNQLRSWIQQRKKTHKKRAIANRFFSGFRSRPEYFLIVTKYLSNASEPI